MSEEPNGGCVNIGEGCILIAIAIVILLVAVRFIVEYD